MKSDSSARPFYTDYAWAFDVLVDRPVRKECAVIAGWFIERGVLPGADILDAGCGTGRHSLELARRGYVVLGVDRSPALIDVASRAGETAPGRASFAVGDIAALPAAQYAAILCRGVLNDVIEDDQRDAVFSAFGRALLPNGTLVLDVREWHASMDRKTAEPLYRKRVSTDRGELTFTSVTELDVDNRLLLVSERHELVSNGEVRVSDGRFVMRCWERDELDARLARHGFGNVQYFGAYDVAVPAGATDRLVVVANRVIG